MALADLIDNVESGNNPNAANSRSSASGPGQFINSTWLAMVKQHRPDIAAGKSDAQILALKDNPDLSREMTGDYASDNAGILQKNGLPVTPGTEYLAHFAGPGGAVGLLNADPGTPAASVLGAAFAKANPTLAGYSAGDLVNLANRKMGGPSASASSSSPPATAPMSIAGPAGAPQSATAAATPSLAPAQNSAQAPAAPRRPAPVMDPNTIAQIAAVPAGQNLLPQRPNYLAQLAPFSLGG